MAAKVLIVKVTQEHIDKARELGGGSECCPIAVAAKELTGKQCGVTDTRIRVGNYSSPLFFKISIPAKKFIKAFDGGRSVTPATFRLSAMESSPYL